MVLPTVQYLMAARPRCCARDLRASAMDSTVNAEPALRELTGSGTIQVAALTGLRAIAAIGVFLVHVQPVLAGTVLGSLELVVGAAGATGVTLFFVLSGYLLSQPSALRGGTLCYAARRIARIYPVYLTSLVAMTFLLGAMSVRDGRRSPLLDPGLLALNVMLGQSWSPDGWYASVVYPAWSLSVEMLFYALLPVILPRLQRAALRRPAASLAVVLAAGALGAAGEQFHWFSVTFPPAYLPVFLVGSWLAVVRPRPLRPGRATALVGAALATHCAFAGATGLGAAQGPSFAVLALPYGLLVHSLASDSPNRHRRHPSRRPLVRLGKASYAFFLIHAMVISVVAGLAGDSAASLPGALLVCVVALVGAWVLALALFHTVEVPAQRAVLRLARRWYPPLHQVLNPARKVTT